MGEGRVRPGFNQRGNHNGYYGRKHRERLRIPFAVPRSVVETLVAGQHHSFDHDHDGEEKPG